VSARTAHPDLDELAQLDGVTSTKRPRIGHEPLKIAVAEVDSHTRGWLEPMIGQLGATVHEAEDGEALERMLEQHGPFSLVITSGRLRLRSGLSVLARARSRGTTTPFIVVASVHGALLRVFVSNAEGTVLSSRLVDGDNLRNLALNLIETTGRR
jgi:CheY-like chemotaxis protein